MITVNDYCVRNAKGMHVTISENNWGRELEKRNVSWRVCSKDENQWPLNARSPCVESLENQTVKLSGAAEQSLRQLSKSDE